MITLYGLLLIILFQLLKFMFPFAAIIYIYCSIVSTASAVKLREYKYLPIVSFVIIIGECALVINEYMHGYIGEFSEKVILLLVTMLFFSIGSIIKAMMLDKKLKENIAKIEMDKMASNERRRMLKGFKHKKNEKMSLLLLISLDLNAMIFSKNYLTDSVYLYLIIVLSFILLICIISYWNIQAEKVILETDFLRKNAD